MKRPYFSIIIPTLNEEKFLPKLLNDFKKQKEHDFEIIIIDGDSEDRTKEVAGGYKKNFIHFKILEAKKRNVSYQRNLGAKWARGTYLIFLDADARVSSSFISEIKKELDKRKNLIFIPTIFPQSRLYQDKIVFNLANFLIELSQITGKPFSAGSSMIFQKDFFHFIGGFDDKLFLAEDHEIIQRARKFGVIAKVLKNIKIKFSLRRMEREGRLDIFAKYLIASIHTFTKGQIDKNIFDYEMGGRNYQFIKNKHLSLEKTIKIYFKRLKNQIKQLIIKNKIYEKSFTYRTSGGRDGHL